MNIRLVSLLTFCLALLSAGQSMATTNLAAQTDQNGKRIWFVFDESKTEGQNFGVVFYDCESEKQIAQFLGIEASRFTKTQLDHEQHLALKEWPRLSCDPAKLSAEFLTSSVFFLNEHALVSSSLEEKNFYLSFSKEKSPTLSERFSEVFQKSIFQNRFFLINDLGDLDPGTQILDLDRLTEAKKSAHSQNFQQITGPFSINVEGQNHYVFSVEYKNALGQSSTLYVKSVNGVAFTYRNGPALLKGIWPTAHFFKSGSLDKLPHNKLVLFNIRNQEVPASPAPQLYDPDAGSLQDLTPVVQAARLAKNTDKILLWNPKASAVVFVFKNIEPEFLGLQTAKGESNINTLWQEIEREGSLSKKGVHYFPELFPVFSHEILVDSETALLEALHSDCSPDHLKHIVVTENLPIVDQIKWPSQDCPVIIEGGGNGREQLRLTFSPKPVLYGKSQAFLFDVNVPGRFPVVIKNLNVALDSGLDEKRVLGFLRLRSQYWKLENLEIRPVHATIVDAITALGLADLSTHDVRIGIREQPVREAVFSENSRLTFLKTTGFATETALHLYEGSDVTLSGSYLQGDTFAIRARTIDDSYAPIRVNSYKSYLSAPAGSLLSFQPFLMTKASFQFGATFFYKFLNWGEMNEFVDPTQNQINLCLTDSPPHTDDSGIRHGMSVLHCETNLSFEDALGLWESWTESPFLNGLL